MGSLVQLFAFITLGFKILKTQSVMGISLQTLQCYACVYFARSLSVLFFQGYLPYDKSGDWLYQFCEVVSLFVVLYDIYLVAVTFKTTHNRHLDSFGAVNWLPPGYGNLLLIVPALILAILFHANLNHYFLTDVCWMFAQYLEAVSILPQLHMFSRNKTGEVETFTSHFVFGLAVSRFLQFCFWSSTYRELTSPLSKVNVGYFVLFSQIIQIGLMGNYIYYYVVSISSGGPMRLPVLVNTKL